jgi:uncharacterized membrane protein
MLDVNTILVILAAAAATYLTRVSGYLIIKRFHTLHPRVEAALNAVPAAVLTTLFAPALINGGWDIKLTMAVALLVGLRYPGLGALAAGWVTAMVARHLLGL